MGYVTKTKGRNFFKEKEVTYTMSLLNLNKMEIEKKKKMEIENYLLNLAIWRSLKTLIRVFLVKW